MFGTNSLISEVAVIIFRDSISSFAADGTVEWNKFIVAWFRKPK